jgi:hypothetical protein
MIYSVYLIPSTDIKSEKFRAFLYRGEDIYNTTWLPWSNFYFYLIVNVTGFVYVNMSNLNCNRNLIQSGKDRYFDFICAIFVAAVAFFIGPIIILRSSQDLDSTLFTVPYSERAVLGYNSIWFCCFFVGLQFTHLDRGPMR